MQKLAQICIERPVFATMLTLALVVLGGFSFFSLGVDLFPNIDLPVVTVSVVNPGASPQEMESQISKRIEDAVNTISGVDEIRSNSVEGLSLVFITFDLEKNGDVAAQEVRDRVNLIGDLPPTARTPIVQKLDPGAAPVLKVAVSASRPIADVTRIAEQRIKPLIENMSGVGQVEILGGVKQEIGVQVEPDRMRAYGVTVPEIVNALRLQNLEAPAGRIDEGARELTVRTMGRIADADRFGRIAVATRGGQTVQLGDLARVDLGTSEQRTAATLNGNPAVTIVVSKQSGQNTVAVADAVKERLAEIQATLPQDIRMETVGDQSVFIKAAVDSIEEHLLEGGLIASLIVFLFLRNIRSTFIAALAIPTSLIATFALMQVVHYTLNQVTMLALTLMVGIVIDDAIVVLENIYRFVEEKGMEPFEAASKATGEIGLAVMATTLSLMAVFLPVAFMKGIVGRVMSSFGLTSAFAVGVSLFVSFTLTPMLSARLIRKPAKRPEGGPHGGTKATGFYKVIEDGYLRMLEWSMAHRWAVVAICALVVLSTIPLFMVVGKNFLPTDDQSGFEVTLRAPEGSTLAATELLGERIATELRTLPGAKDSLLTVGGGQDQQVNAASIFVKLRPLGERKTSQAELITRARALLASYPKQMRIAVQPVASTSSLGSRNADVQYVVRGPDLDKLAAYSQELVAQLQQSKDAVDIDSSLITGKPEVRIEIDRDRAADLGVSVADIAQTLNTLIASQEVSTFDSGQERFPVRIQATPEFRSSEEGLRRLFVSSSKLGLVSLASVARLVEGTGPATIERLNRERQVTLSANLRAGGSQAGVIGEMDQFVKGMRLLPGYTAGPAGASRELNRAAVYFLIAVALSFIFMYMVLASQFESFIQPVIILATLPLSVPCGVFALLIAGQSVNLFAGLGLLLLFGVVKKNAILQLDHTNVLRKHGMNRHDAMIAANRDRLRPILMTTCALVGGMMPLVISSGAGSGTNRSIGVMVVGGQSLCLLLTLLAVPVFYSLVEDLREKSAARATLGRFARWRKAAANS
jgi:hydrophobic/amphiphilic exporter-1 (mainly G- bacteria), HAE1 family